MNNIQENNMESYGEYKTQGETKRYLKLDKIENQKDAYLVGYLYGDGGFILNRGFSFLMVSSIGKDIIESFRNRYCPDSSIYNVGKKSSKRVRAINDAFELRFPPRFSKQLDKFGVFCYKKDRQLKGIPDRFFIDVLHGLIDADGFWTVGERHDCREDRLRCFITHQSQFFLRDIQNKLETLYNISSSIFPHTSGKCYRLSIQNTESCRMLASLILVSEVKGSSVKSRIIESHLRKYDYVLQKSDELLETLAIGNQQPSPKEREGSETT